MVLCIAGRSSGLLGARDLYLLERSRAGAGSCISGCSDNSGSKLGFWSGIAVEGCWKAPGGLRWVERRWAACNWVIGSSLASGSGGAIGREKLIATVGGDVNIGNKLSAFALPEFRGTLRFSGCV